MSQPDINSFLSSMVEAKRALDAEPQYQARIRELEQKLSIDGHTIAQREQRIHELKQAEDSLVQKLRSVEAERDDAGFRALEEADKVQAMLTLMRSFIGDAIRCVATVEGVEPPTLVTAQDHAIAQGMLTESMARIRSHELEIGGLKEHVKMLENETYSLKASLEQAQRPLAIESPPESTASSTGVIQSSERDWSGGEADSFSTGQRGVDPTIASTQSWSGSPTEATSAGPVGGTSGEEATAQPDPFASSPTPPTEPPSASSGTVESIESVASTGSKERNRDPLTRFLNRKYFDVTYYVPLYDWLNGGGTEADYYWKPDHTPTGF
jgi:hypothetical protein